MKLKSDPSLIARELKFADPDVQGANLRGSRTANSKSREDGMARKRRSDLKTESRMTPSRATISSPLMSEMKTSVMKNTRRN